MQLHATGEVLTYERPYADVREGLASVERAHADVMTDGYGYEYVVVSIELLDELLLAKGFARA